MRLSRAGAHPDLPPTRPGAVYLCPGCRARVASSDGRLREHGFAVADLGICAASGLPVAGLERAPDRGPGPPFRGHCRGSIDPP